MASAFDLRKVPQNWFQNIPDLMLPCYDCVLFVILYTGFHLFYWRILPRYCLKKVLKNENSLLTTPPIAGNRGSASSVLVPKGTVLRSLLSLIFSWKKIIILSSGTLVHICSNHFRFHGVIQYTIYIHTYYKACESKAQEGLLRKEGMQITWYCLFLPVIILNRSVF